MLRCPEQTDGRRTKRRGFTLVELLVAMAVLSMMVAMLGQMLHSVSAGWLGGKARASSFTKARSMMDLMTRDVQGGVYRDDLAAFANLSASTVFTNVAFYTRRSGVPVGGGGTGMRNISLVAYSLNSDGMLQRGDMPMYWNGVPSSTTTFGTTNSLPRLDSITERDTVPGTLAFKVLFLGTNGIFTPNYDPVNRPKAMAIGMVFTDDASLKKLTSAQIANLQTAFANHLSGTNSPKADWDAYVNGGGFNWGSYPSDLSRGLKIFERYVVLP